MSLTYCCRLSPCPELELGAGAEFHLAVRGDDNRLPLYLHIRGQHRLCRPLKRVAPVLRIPGADAMQPVERPKLGKVSRDIDMLARLGGVFVRNHNELNRYRARRDKAEQAIRCADVILHLPHRPVGAARGLSEITEG